MTPCAGLVIGFGNPLCGDDALGWVVVEQLRRHPACQHLPLITSQQLTPELAVDLAGADWVYFVDISENTGEDGVCQYPVQPATLEDGFSLLGHYLAPGQLLALTRQTFKRAPKEAYVVTCSGTHFGVGEAMSPAVKALLPEFEAHLLRELRSRCALEVECTKS